MKPKPPAADPPEVRFTRDGDWLVAHAAGTCDLAWFKGIIPKVLEESQRSAAQGVLIDARELKAIMSDIDKFEMGVAVAQAKALPPLAFVALEEYLDPRRLGEMAARNRGANLRVFTDIDAARAWLVEATA